MLALDTLDYVRIVQESGQREPSRVAVRRKIFLASVMIYSLAAASPRAASAQHITIDGSLHTAPAQMLLGPNPHLQSRPVGGLLPAHRLVVDLGH